MKIKRFYLDRMLSMLQPGKVLAIYGARRSGKTTLIKDFLKTWTEGRYFLGTGEDRAVREVLESSDVNLLRSSFSGYSLVVIDEAQAMANVGAGLKLLVDMLPEVKVIASGSSSFQLASGIGEPLTGRQRTATLYPVAVMELDAEFGGMALRQRLDELLVYGSYPEVLTIENVRDKAEALHELCNSYLLKDIFAFERLRNADKIHRLLCLLAFQVGKEVSITELGTGLGLNRFTVERYIDLLEKTFVIFRMPGFSRNLRSEVTKTSRYYFRDNGIMNAIVNNFNPLYMRNGNDVGALWENFIVAERMKKQEYSRILSNNYFWRTYERQEIDLVEEREGRLYGYEIKYGKAKPSAPSLWKESYPDATYQVISRQNFADFV
ncbi:MAG: ATP-binding protein, partial [Victivallales bacterium]|nr:ATP-binding protein [Victivallales bacterium]